MAEAGSATAAWDLTDLYPSDAAWEAERQAILKAIPSLKALSGQARRQRGDMKAALQAGSDLNKRTSRLYSYASLKADEDRRVAPNQERKQQAQDVFTALGEATAWANPEIVAAGRGQGQCADRRRSGPEQVRASGCATRCGWRRIPCRRTRSSCSRRPRRRSPARRTFATSSPRRTFRGRR